MSIGLFLDVDRTLTVGLIQQVYARVLGCEPEFLAIEREYAKSKHSDRFGQSLVALFARHGFTELMAVQSFDRVELAPSASELLRLDVDRFLVSTGPSYFVEELARRHDIPADNVISSTYVFDGPSGVISGCRPSSAAAKARFVRERVGRFAVSLGVGDSVADDGPFIDNCTVPILRTASDSYLAAPDLRIVKHLVENLALVNGAKSQR